MSLINDALKKAQNADAAAGDGGLARCAGFRPHGRPDRRRMNFERILLLVVALVAVIVGATAVTLLLLRKNDRPVVAQAAATAPCARGCEPPRAVPAGCRRAGTGEDECEHECCRSQVRGPPGSVLRRVQTVESALAPMVTVAAVHPAAPPVSLPPPAAAAVSVNTGASPAPVVVNVEPTPPASPGGSVRASSPASGSVAEKRSRILAFIDNAHIAGVRMAGGDSKVLMK